ncbi:MAG: family 78 glycoside hydrolase catalytic domain, partial [Actinobacteria bacterium]|nr:family 78 glycoside hydrolase catalytic domain [Actinomycetota bacterium]
MTQAVGNLRCEYLVDPLGIDVVQPRLSWVLRSARQGARQTAYQVLVASSETTLRDGIGDLWDSGFVSSGETAQIAYQGKPLLSGQRCHWKVRAWLGQDESYAESEPARWEMALLSAADWRAQWIALFRPDELRPCPLLRREFPVRDEIARARVYATALGLYELYCNGHLVGDGRLRPGWTDYGRRVHYQTYDVGPLIVPGANAVGILLADGWYCGHVGNTGRDRYGARPQALVQVVVEYPDGTVETTGTDQGWKGTFGPVLKADLLMGETYDARREQRGWSAQGFDDSTWSTADLGEGTPGRLVAQCSEPVRVVEELTPVAISESAPGKFVYDFGQNMPGWARLRVRGKRGTAVQLRFAEMVNPGGTLYTDNLRTARCTDSYTLSGGAEEVWEPSFTYRGFRYVEVNGFPGLPGPEAVIARVAHSALTETGSFTCSNELVNQLHRNILWGQRSNFVHV